MVVRDQNSVRFQRASTQVLVIPAGKYTRVQNSVTAVTQNAAGTLVSVYMPEDIAVEALKGEDYPVLAEIWDNPEDAIFDNL